MTDALSAAHTHVQQPQARDVLVVGASSTIGLAIAQAFASRADRVLGTWNTRAPEASDDAAMRWRQLDLTDTMAVQAFAMECESAHSGFDVVVAVTGLILGQALDDYERSDIDRVLAVNFGGVADLLARLQPVLREGSCVLLLSSISGERGSYDPVYAAAKAAQVAFVKSMATHGARTRYIAVAPALVEGSGMMETMLPQRREHHRKQAPLGRLITPPELAAIVADLSQPHWAYANGTCVRINGGVYV